MEKLIIICGPTGSGKTDLAIKLARKFNSEIISADSMSIYKGMDIGTAKPSKEEQSLAKHHMIDVVSPFSSFSVQDYEDMSMPIIERLHSEGKIPIICGGTGFYIKSLLYDFSYGGTVGSQEFRDKYDEKVRNNGPMSVYEELLSIDPISAQNIEPNDSKRVIRALEIYYLTGKTKSSQNDLENPKFDFLCFIINHKRDVLYDRINLRVDKMLENGLIDEVKNFKAMGLNRSYQSTDGIGYKEVFDCLDSGDFTNLAETLKINSRHYAKRQLTFFKKFKNMYYLSPDNPFEEMCNILIEKNYINS